MRVINEGSTNYWNNASESRMGFASSCGPVGDGNCRCDSVCSCESACGCDSQCSCDSKSK